MRQVLVTQFTKVKKTWLLYFSCKSRWDFLTNFFHFYKDFIFVSSVSIFGKISNIETLYIIYNFIQQLDRQFRLWLIFSWHIIISLKVLNNVTSNVYHCYLTAISPSDILVPLCICCFLLKFAKYHFSYQCPKISTYWHAKMYHNAMGKTH